MEKTYRFHGVSTKKIWHVDPMKKEEYNACPECGREFSHSWDCESGYLRLMTYVAGVSSYIENTSKMIPIYDETTEYDYKVGEEILINEKYVKIESVVREPQTGIYHVQTNCVVEHTEDLESKQQAENDLIEFKEKIQNAEKVFSLLDIPITKDYKGNNSGNQVSNESHNDAKNALIGGLVFLCIALGFLLLIR